MDYTVELGSGKTYVMRAFHCPDGITRLVKAPAFLWTGYDSRVAANQDYAARRLGMAWDMTTRVYNPNRRYDPKTFEEEFAHWMKFFVGVDYKTYMAPANS